MRFKVVGDLAIFMVQNDLTPENIVERGKALAFPDSVVSYFKGMMGQPAWGFPEDLQKVVLKGEEPITCRPGKLLPPVDFDQLESKSQSSGKHESYHRIQIGRRRYLHFPGNLNRTKHGVTIGNGKSSLMT